MSEAINYNDRFRPRAQSLFENRQRTYSELTISLLDRFLTSRKLTNISNETTAPSSDECEFIIRNGTRRTIFFICQPLIAGLLVFPLLILFWQAGWNFMVELIGPPPPGKHRATLPQHWTTLPILYIMAQVIFLLIYLNQDRLYDYLHKRKNKLFICIILQCHNFLTSSTYILQWVSMWTIWDLYTSADWLLMLIVSVAAILAVIAIMGHPCDLVCAPFILSYDSIEYNIRIGSPFVTEKINECLAHFLNYIFYEFIMSLLSILAWRGSYKLLDVFLYPENPHMSAALSLCLGYPFYFLLMYTQSYSDKSCLLPTFIYLNYPSFIQTIRHLTAFFTCILLWRGFWLLFDEDIATMSLAKESPCLFYILCMSISFFILSLMRTASSINGPMSHMSDRYDLFPHYPNCYLIHWFNQMESSDETASDSSRNTTIEPYSNSFL
ncbi:unnamed protein product [Adineta steineri]|uniref:Transmembrane protein n=1 Tax=Adineta steineri TaxID=433720 RepID=A0A819N9N1_9BILA|nr:unnamed protein product [Adineta steineri]CAF3994415.1 unnamed protein product [Adineta steineri]